MPNPKKKYLAITADDYGPHPFINRGILDAARQGLITSVGVFANPYDGIEYDIDREIDKLVEAIDGKPIGIGAHLTLSSGRPITKSKHLKLEKGQFQRPQSFDFGKGKKHLQAIGDEIEAQIETIYRSLNRLGLPLDHVSSHQGLHYLFGHYFSQMLDALDRLGVKTVLRSPVAIWNESGYSNYFFESNMHAEGKQTALRMINDNLPLGLYIRNCIKPETLDKNRRLIYDRGYGCADHFFDNLYGKPSPAELMNVFQYFPGGNTVNRGEIVVHLGKYTPESDLELHGINNDYFHYRTDELAVLSTFDFAKAANDHKVELRRMGELC